MTSTLERRYTAAPLEFRSATTDSGVGTLYGYAAKYNRLSQNLGGFVERVAPSAFTKSLGDKHDVLARYNHDDNALLGRTTSGTLALASDETGLAYDVTLPDTSVGRDLAVLARRGDVHQSSFAFYVMPDGEDWAVTENGFPLRTITSARLVDVAPVNMPAYLDTSSAMRSLAERVHTDDVEIRSMPTDEIVRRLTTPTVIDLGSAAPDAQRDTHASVAVARARLRVISLRAQ